MWNYHFFGRNIIFFQMNIKNKVNKYFTTEVATLSYFDLSLSDIKLLCLPRFIDWWLLYSILMITLRLYWLDSWFSSVENNSLILQRFTIVSSNERPRTRIQRFESLPFSHRDSPLIQMIPAVENNGQLLPTNGHWQAIGWPCWL